MSVNKIIEIGKKNFCSKEDLFFFLPDYPTLHGSEFIFSLPMENAIKYTDENVEYFIKGLHRIEDKYKKETGYNSGFGSPSRTFKVISRVRQINIELADKLEIWVSQNGGNYYIKPDSATSSLSDNRTNLFGNES